MTRPALHAAPRGRDVFVEQLRVVGLALRTPSIVVMALLGVLTVRELFDGRPPAGFHPELSMLPGIVGLLIPFALWKGDEHDASGYFWTLPVDRRAHTLARLGAGWTWLMAFVTIAVVWELGLYLIGGGSLRADETFRVLPVLGAPITGRVDPAVLQNIRWTPQPLLWLVPFTAATGVYLLASALVVATRRPLRSAAIPLIVLAAIFVIGDIGRVQWIASSPQQLIQPLLVGRYGLDALLTASTESLHTEVTLTTGRVVAVWQALPDLRAWATATALWMAVGVVALSLATYRLRERRRP